VPTRMLLQNSVLNERPDKNKEESGCPLSSFLFG
jgi:hypothetical protein